jgi:HSP20 family protein
MSFDENDPFWKTFREMFEQFENMLKNYDGKIPSKTMSNVWGIEFKTLPDGRVEVRRFGGSPYEKPQLPKRMLEPMVDVIDQVDKILIILEIPGVEESELELFIETEAGRKIFVIRSKNKERPYYRKILLPDGASKKFTHAPLKNGILEVSVEKIKA